MLVMPNAFSKMGFSAAFPIAIFMGFVSVYTAFLLVALYCERKARLVSPPFWKRPVLPSWPWVHRKAKMPSAQSHSLLPTSTHQANSVGSCSCCYRLIDPHGLQVRAGIWYGPNGERRIVSQYHETMGFFLGQWGRWIALTLVCLDLLGTNVAQVRHALPAASLSDAGFEPCCLRLLPAFFFSLSLQCSSEKVSDGNQSNSQHGYPDSLTVKILVHLPILPEVQFQAACLQ